MHYLDKFAPLLEKGETVKWTGKPEPFNVVEEYNKKSMYLRWIITAVAAVAVMIWYIIYTSNSPDVSFSWVIALVIIAVAAFLIIRPFTDARTIMKKRFYAITNQRVIIYENDNVQHSKKLDEIDVVKIIDKGNNTGDVIIGEEAVARRYSSIRITAFVPIKGIGDQENVITGMALYNVKGISEIKSLLALGTKVIEEKYNKK